MMRIFLVGLMLATAAWAQVRPIREVRQNDSQGVPVLLDSTVTVTGVMSEVGHFGGWGPAYMEDVTGGVAIYGSACGGLAIGDSVTVTGDVELFYGLVELTDLEVVNHGAVGAPTPKSFTLPDIAVIDTAAGYVETEGWLVRFEQVWIMHTPGEQFQGNHDYTVSDGDGYQAEMRIDADASELVGLDIPDDSIDLTGVIGQHIYDPPYFGGYQVMPRMAADLGVSIQFMPIARAIRDESGDGKPDLRGQSVLVSGVVTAPSGIFNNEYLDIYVQDSSAGVNVFDWDLITLEVGDSVMVSGEVDWYKGKTEISGATVTVLGTGTVPEPLVLTCAEINVEAHEGELVRLVGITTLAQQLAGNENYQVDDATGTAAMRIDAETEIPGLSCVRAPDTFSLTGIKSQYAYDTLNPFDGYQISPRFRSDFSRTAEDMPILTIAEVQRPGADGVTPVYLDSTVRIRGRVTGPSSSFTVGSSKSLYIEDETQGINVYGCSFNSAHEPLLDSLGIEWEVMGTIIEYNGLTEIANGSMSVTDSVAVPVEPRALPYNTPLTELMESDLVTVVGDVIEPPTRSGSGYNITIKNGSAGIMVRVGENSGIGVSWITRGRRIRVTGVVGQYDYEEPYNSGYQLLPRFNSDVADTSGAFPPTELLAIDTVTPNPFKPYEGEVATIQVNSPAEWRLTVTVLDMEGRTVRELLTEAVGGFHDLKWDGTDRLQRPKPAGIYLVNVKGVPPGGGLEMITKPVVIAMRLH